MKDSRRHCNGKNYKPHRKGTGFRVPATITAASIAKLETKGNQQVHRVASISSREQVFVTSTRANVSAGSNRGNPSRGKAVLRQCNNAFSSPPGGHRLVAALS
jgi:hypothetical protein